MALTDTIIVKEADTVTSTFTSDSVLMDNFTMMSFSLTFTNRSDIDMLVELEVSSSSTGGYTTLTGSEITISDTSDETETYLIDQVTFKHIRAKCTVNGGSCTTKIEITRKY